MLSSSPQFPRHIWTFAELEAATDAASTAAEFCVEALAQELQASQGNLESTRALGAAATAARNALTAELDSLPVSTLPQGLDGGNIVWVSQW